MLRCIAGFEPLQGGEIALADRVLSRPGMHVLPEKRGVGMVFQDFALFPHLRVAANVGFGLTRLDAEARARRVDEMLALVGLAGAAEAYPHELSGGQQQRVALARALAPSPDLLLLDEPFSNLDIDLRERLSIEVREILKDAGITAILVTHDQHEAFALADDIGIMKDGVIEQWDGPYDLYYRPRTRFVADFVGQGVLLPGVCLGGGRIEIELGELRADAGGTPVAQGARVDVLLRPDHILHDDASARRAVIRGKAFRGAEFVYTLELDSGARVLCRVDARHDHAVGERIGIRVDVDRVAAFPAVGPSGS